MQIALHDIRRFGYTKICKVHDICQIIDNLKELYIDLDIYDDSSFSVLNNWADMQPYLSNYFSGFVDLVNNYTPLVEDVGVDIVAKRKFRNTWNKIWKNISNDLKWDKVTTDLLSNFGIKLVYFLSSSDNIEISDNLYDIIEFYTLLFKWSIFTEKELNFERNNLTHVQVIEIMTIQSNKDFANFILKKIV